MDFEKMNLFAAVEHTDDNKDLEPDFMDMSEQQMMDYMVMVITRELKTAKAFKGGYVLNQLLGTDSMTHDVDFSIGEKRDYEEVKSVLTEIATEFKKYNLIEEYKIKEEIKETMSGGIDFFDSAGRKFLGVDVGLHDIGWGVKSYDFSFVTTDAFEVERMLSDKMIAITSRKRFRRTKDLYDFFIITAFFDFDYKKLVDYIKRRGGAEWDNIPFKEEVIVQYKRAWDKLSLISSMTGAELNKPDFDVVIQRFYSVAIPIKAKQSFNKWNHIKEMLQC